jgi:hypothetical protein
VNNNREMIGDYVLIDGYTPTPKSTDDWYFTTNGVKIPLNMTWAAGEPNGEAEQCLSLGPKNIYFFNDIPCNSNSYAVLCELKGV